MNISVEECKHHCVMSIQKRNSQQKLFLAGVASCRNFLVTNDAKLRRILMTSKNLAMFTDFYDF